MEHRVGSEQRAFPTGENGSHLVGPLDETGWTYGEDAAVLELPTTFIEAITDGGGLKPDGESLAARDHTALVASDRNRSPISSQTDRNNPAQGDLLESGERLWSQSSQNQASSNRHRERDRFVR